MGWTDSWAATMVVSVCLCGQCLEDSSSHCPFPVSVCGDKQGKAGAGQGRAGRPGQPLRGAGRGAISIKEILGENRGTCPVYQNRK
jgi:hypothetical protein